RDLRRAVSEGKFREDLYYRLAVFPIQVPPLRERAEDVVPLARAFAAELRGTKGELRLAPQGEKALRGHAWPGNVRELRNFVERLHLLRDPGPLVVDEDAATLLGPAPGGSKAGVDGLGTLSYRELCEEAERGILKEALARCGG